MVFISYFNPRIIRLCEIVVICILIEFDSLFFIGRFVCAGQFKICFFSLYSVKNIILLGLLGANLCCKQRTRYINISIGSAALFVETFVLESAQVLGKEFSSSLLSVLLLFPELPSSGFAGVLVDVLPPPVDPPLPPLPGLDGPSSPQAVSIETAMAAASRQTAAFLKSLIVDTSIVCSEYPRMCSIYHIIPPQCMCQLQNSNLLFLRKRCRILWQNHKKAPLPIQQRSFPSVTVLPFSAWPAPRSGWCIPWYTGRASHRRRGADRAP